MKELNEKRKAVDAIVTAAGEKLLELWPGGEGSSSELDIQRKDDDSLVSAADYASNKILTDGLTELFPGIPFDPENEYAPRYHRVVSDVRVARRASPGSPYPGPAFRRTR